MEHILGFIGTVLVLLAYLLLSAKKIDAQSVKYQGLNLIGAILLIIYAVVLTAWASVLLNVVWGFIAIFALAKLFLTVRKNKTHSSKSFGSRVNSQAACSGSSH